MTRIIFHVDVNNAFLSWTAVYLLNNGYDKDIRTIASVIGGDEEKRHGIVLAKSPIAKKYGIKTAETLYLARRKCPSLEVYQPNYEYYMEMSKKFYNYLKQYTPVIEKASVDECFLDFTGTKYLYDDILELAYKIKNEIKEKFGFTVNVGIGNNKLCAKMASDFLKPDKVHTLFDYEIKEKMWPLPINNLLFVGKSTVSILEKLNIKTIGDLANCNPKVLEKHFKNRVDDLIKSANGIDESKVITDYGFNKCISISRTLEKDTSDVKLLKKVLLDMADQVGLRARENNLFSDIIAITYKTSTFKSYSHQMKLNKAINNTMEIYQNVLKLLQESIINEKIRSIGIRLSNLKIKDMEQMALFNKNTGSDDIQHLIDSINLKYHNTLVMPAIFYENDNNK